MATWLKNELPEEWPQQDITTNSDQSTRSNHSAANSAASSGTTAQIGHTVAIQPDKAHEAQWKQALSPSKVNADHLNGLFEGESEYPVHQEDAQEAEELHLLQDTSASASDLSSIDEQTRRLKLFTQTKNTYTNQRLDALATSLQGHQSDEDKSDIIGNLMNDGNNALSRIRKASNMELRAVYERSKEDSSLDDLNNLAEASNGSTLSSLTDHETTSSRPTKQKNREPLQTPHTAKSLENINPTVRFKTPSQFGPQSRSRLDQDDEIPSLAVPDSFNIEERPAMSFVNSSSFHLEQPLTTSASETSGTAIRPPTRHQVRRETMIHSSRPASSASQSTDPRPQASGNQYQQRQQQQHMQGTVRHRPSQHSAWGSTLSNGHSSNTNAHPSTTANTSVDKVFDVSVAVHSRPLRDIPLPDLDDKNTSIARKNVSFSGALYHLVQQVRSVNQDTDFEVDLSGMDLECLRGLEDLLPQLARANLSNNSIEVVDGLPPMLLELDLSHNSLGRMTTFPLMFLTNLNIQHNHLQDLTSLSQLRALTNLDVSHNKLKALKGIEALYSLETLNVGENALKSLKLSHPKLRHLRAANNHIDAVELDTPLLETLDLSNNTVLALDPIPTVRKLYIANNNAKLNFSGFESLEELHYNGNSMATDFDSISPIVLSWTGATTRGLDAAALSCCQLLSLSSKETLKSLSQLVLPVQQLDLTGMSLKTLPVWLPRCFPNLRCLNLAFNQLDDKALQTVSEFKELRTLGLFGNQIGSISAVTLCLAKLGKLGALDLRGNPVANALYPDMKTLLLDASNGTQTEQYERLLQIDWSMVLEEWQYEPAVSSKFKDYNNKMKQLKLWWLDGASINEKPSPQRVWRSSRAMGLGALRPRQVKQSQTREHSFGAFANSTVKSDFTGDGTDECDSSKNTAADMSCAVAPAHEESEAFASVPNRTNEFDMRFHFQTPSQTHFATPSRVNGTISTIGKARAQAAKATHSTPAPFALNTPASALAPSHTSSPSDTTTATPHTSRKMATSRPLAKSMSRARKTAAAGDRLSSNTLLASLQQSNNSLNAKLTAEFIVSIYRREYDSKR